MICRMKAANISASIAASTFSARRYSQPPSHFNPGFIALGPMGAAFGAALNKRGAGGSRPRTIRSHSVDLIHHSGRPCLGKVGGEILILHMLAEGGDVGLVDLQALPLESLYEFLLA